MADPDADVPDTPRRFLLSDVMTLVVAAALMAGSDQFVRELHPLNSFVLYRESEWRCMGGTVGLMGLNLVLLVSGLMRATDRRRMRAGAPGLIVGFVVAGVLVANLLGWMVGAVVSWISPVGPGVAWRWSAILYYLGIIRKEVAVTILVAWLVLVLVGRWHPESAWDDRLGRFLGGVWLAFASGSSLVWLLP